LGHITKLKKSSRVEEFIYAFEQLAFHAKGMSNILFREIFITGMKEEIHAQFTMYYHTTWLESSQRAREAQKVMDSQIKKKIPLFPILIPQIPFLLLLLSISTN
jgi:hypothetical protein